MYDLEDLAGLFEHGIPDQKMTNTIFGDILDHYGVNLQLVWEQLVENVGFDGGPEVIVVDGGVAYRIAEPARAWIFGETEQDPGAPSGWRGERAGFDPSRLIGDGEHNLAREDV